jgi:hypothetical protein
VKQRVHPLVAAVVIAAALAVVWYSYTSVFTGRTKGQVGTPASVQMTPPPPGLKPGPVRRPAGSAGNGMAAPHPGTRGPSVGAKAEPDASD